jgi:Iron-containing alcohol dehydrogenase
VRRIESARWNRITYRVFSHRALSRGNRESTVPRPMRKNSFGSFSSAGAEQSRGYRHRISTPSDQWIPPRRILFGPLDEGLAAVAPPSPVALLGSPRSLDLIRDEAFGGAAVQRFAGARKHTPREVVREALELVENTRCASIVGIGSSSAIDLAKAVADASGLPLVLIPTALGGAEMTWGYGILEDDRKRVRRLKNPAQTVIYDPALRTWRASRSTRVRSGSTTPCVTSSAG